MKTRIISAIVLVLTCIPPFVLGSFYLDILLSLIICCAAYEVNGLNKKGRNPFLCFLMACFVLAITVGDHYLNLDPMYDFAMIIAYLLILMTITIFKEDLSLDLSAVMFTMSIIIVYAIKTIYLIYERYSASLMLYIMIIALMCDTGAYFVGIKFGKHKLIERVSPKKTVEGAIGGYVISFLVSFTFAYIFKYFGMGITLCLASSLILPFVSMVGDLFFSLVKRYYGIKDYSKLIPGHGGVLDRVDSVIYCLLTFYALVIIL